MDQDNPLYPYFDRLPVPDLEGFPNRYDEENEEQFPNQELVGNQVVPHADDSDDGDEDEDDDEEEEDDDDEEVHREILDPFYYRNSPRLLTLEPLRPDSVLLRQVLSYPPYISSALMVCACSHNEDGPLVPCLSPTCRIGWFHLTCVDNYQENRWHCGECSRNLPNNN